MRVPLKADIIRDRASLVREVEGGQLENVYRVQVMNTTEHPRAYEISATGLPTLHVASATTLRVGATESRMLPVRVRLDLSQGQLANKVGLDRSYINRLEAGERGAPSAHAIVAMASALNLDDLDTDRLLLAGGLPVKALVEVGLDDPLVWKK